MREMRVHVCGRGEEKRGYKIEGGKKRGNTEGVGRCFRPTETRSCWRYMYMYVEGYCLLRLRKLGRQLRKIHCTISLLSHESHDLT